MGGDRVDSVIFSADEESSSIEQDFSDQSLGLPSFLRDDLSTKVDDMVTGENGLVGGRISACDLEIQANRKRMDNVYGEVLRSYDELRTRSDTLEEAKSKILSYTPGGWIEEVGGMSLSDYDVPKTTSLLLVGPKGSGKSSLVNKISSVFEDDKFASERAQISYNSSVGDGTYFLQEYMIPRRSTSFCLHDTRGLLGDSSENVKMLKRWMTKGVRHGELVLRECDHSSFKTRLKYKARQNGYRVSEIRMVNFVIFVVNGLSILKAIESDDETGPRYTQMIATMFNSPFLSFKDDKPVIVVTHGDLLSLSDRARVRVHLAEQLGIPPKTQIFDIPESCDPATELAIVDMLRYCLEHADRNLPVKGRFMGKVDAASLHAYLFRFIILVIAIISAYIHLVHFQHTRKDRLPQSNSHTDWNAIRHMWLGSEYD
ncbi:unnamed protein product [Ilex paraguariensis]|uniref:Uncharacterized protein n=1 Tax=Ilex paraguariensis TaxID=185542 RepID=A0ABC8R864_9AQUA